MTFDKQGVWFRYKGDEVGLLYPWKWHKAGPFVSVSFEASFRSLRELDDTWSDYMLSEAYSEIRELQTRLHAAENVLRQFVFRTAPLTPEKRTALEAYDEATK